MYIIHLSIFVENKAGRLEAIVDALAKNGINIRALSIADTTDFGILRVIVDDCDKAKKVLSDIGVISKSTEVFAVYMDDRAGGLHSFVKLLSDGNVSIEYMYAFLGREEGKALMVLKADDEKKAHDILTGAGVEIASPDNM